MSKAIFKLSRSVVALSMLLAGAGAARADLDPCPSKHQEFQSQAAALRSAWHKENAKVSGAQFSRPEFEAEYRKWQISVALQDLEGVIKAYNLTNPKKTITVTKASLQMAAKTKVDLSLASPEGKRAKENVMEAAENHFLQAKASTLMKLAEQKKEADAQVEAARKQLDGNCTYDFPSQMVRIGSNVLELKTSFEDGILNIATFNTPLKKRNGQLWYGDHPLMDLPTMTASGLTVGGQNIAPMPTIRGGNLELPVLPGVPPLVVPLPHVQIGPFKF